MTTSNNAVTGLNAGLQLNIHCKNATVRNTSRKKNSVRTQGNLETLTSCFLRKVLLQASERQTSLRWGEMKEPIEPTSIKILQCSFRNYVYLNVLVTFFERSVIFLRKQMRVRILRRKRSQLTAGIRDRSCNSVYFKLCGRRGVFCFPHTPFTNVQENNNNVKNPKAQICSKPLLPPHGFTRSSCRLNSFWLALLGGILSVLQSGWGTQRRLAWRWQNYVALSSSLTWASIK